MYQNQTINKIIRNSEQEFLPNKYYVNVSSNMIITNDDNDVTATYLQSIIDFSNHPIRCKEYISNLKQTLNTKGVATLPNFLLETTRQTLLTEAVAESNKAYYTKSTHSVYLSPKDSSLPDNHAFNRQVTSSKGCITTDQIPPNSLLKKLYYNPLFQQFCAKILNVERLYPYADPLSEINVHYYKEGQELGWHFDNSSFAITLLLQAPEEGGGRFEYLPNLRDSSSGDNSYNQVEKVLDGELKGRVLQFDPGTLVLFRGRDSLHRVSPVKGNRTRILVVLAYNDQPGVCLSKEARMTFFGRTGMEDDDSKE